MKKPSTLTILIFICAALFSGFSIIAYLVGLTELLIYMPIYIFLHVIFFKLRVRFKRWFIGYIPAIIPLFLMIFQGYLIIITLINSNDPPVFLAFLVGLSSLLFIIFGGLFTYVLEKTYYPNGVFEKTEQVEKTLRLLTVLSLPVIMAYLFLSETVGNPLGSQLVFLGASVMSTLVFALGLTYIKNNSKASLFNLSWISALIFILMFFYLRVEVITSLMALASSLWLFTVLIYDYFFKESPKNNVKYNRSK